MPTLHRLESPQRDSTIGGILITFDSGRAKSVSWKSSTRVDETQLAKKCTEELIQSCLQENASSDLDGTNWVSMCAGIGKHIADWNASLTETVDRGQ